MHLVGQGAHYRSIKMRWILSLATWNSESVSSRNLKSVCNLVPGRDLDLVVSEENLPIKEQKF